MMNNNQILAKIDKKIIPVVDIKDLSKIDGIINYLINIGTYCIEVTFRTAYAAESIKYIKENYPEILVGAGTIYNIERAEKAVASGADFLVAPGLNLEVINFAKTKNILIIPGIETASEIEAAMNMGIYFVKFFPAEAIGGVKKIKALSAPYSEIKFMPTGGITIANVDEYMALPNVVCCGGSFIVPKELL